MTAPRVKVMRLEIMLTSMDDCDVIDADVGATALACVRKVLRRAMMASARLVSRGSKRP